MKQIIYFMMLALFGPFSITAQQTCEKFALRTQASFHISPTLTPAISQTWQGDGQSRIQHLFFDIDNIKAKSSDLDKSADHVYLEENNFRLRFFSHDPHCPDTNKFDEILLKQGSGALTQIFTNPGEVALRDVFISHLPSNFQSLGYDSVEFEFKKNGSICRKIGFKYTIIPKSDDHYQDAAGNTITVWKSPSSNGIPIVAAEGVDFTDTRPAQYYWRLDGARMFECMLNAGFDIYMVDFARGQEDIIYNAEHFQYAIRKVAADAGRNVVAVGFSMGGVINRYACAQAEDAGNPLPISHMVSIDAPQQGAVINRDAQRFLHFSEIYLQQLNSELTITTCNENNGARNIEHQFNRLKTPTALQLLNFNFQDPNIANSSVTENTSLYAAMDTLNGDGYPHLAKTIGVSFGNLMPNPGASLPIVNAIWPSIPGTDADQNFAASLLNAGISVQSAGIGFLAQIFNDVESSQAGSFFPELPSQYETLWNLMPTSNKMTFMPINSTLDLQDSLVLSSSKFDTVIHSAVMNDHDNIPADIRTPLLIELLLEDLYIQNKTYSSTHDIYGIKNIIAGSNVDPAQTAGSVTITSTGNVQFRAGESISLQGGFSVDPGGYFITVIDTDEPECGDTFQQGQIADNSTVLQQEESEQVDIESAVKPFKVGVFPNPIESGELQVDLKVEAEGAASIILFSIDGKVVLTVNTPSILTEGEHQFQLNVNELRSGMYFLEVLVDNHGQITKVVKQ